jgi:hypothetical protein
MGGLSIYHITRSLSFFQNLPALGQIHLMLGQKIGQMARE